MKFPFTHEDVNSMQYAIALNCIGKKEQLYRQQNSPFMGYGSVIAIVKGVTFI